ncbi:LPXTG cell wall anchor domain-containing protein [Listeria ilorinensis]|uniref:LPXTG cell wall anchor domain-containing protein n=1 Tax=Listeria ilorinensis TaxID=2867439 RepID=UPI001EF6E29A|nr:LPXTG cell wall anchor domain-containing protein [Listeria ilorinensis]
MRKIARPFLWIASLSFILYMLSLSVQAESYEPYSSNAQIGFYGTYEPSAPDKERHPDTPYEVPTPATQINGESASVSSPEFMHLPQTGDTKEHSLILLGLVLLSAGYYIYQKGKIGGKQ